MLNTLSASLLLRGVSINSAELNRRSTGAEEGRVVLKVTNSFVSVGAGIRTVIVLSLEDSKFTAASTVRSFS